MDRSGWDFFAELAKFGPRATRAPSDQTLPQAEAYCRYVATSHYENFQIASWFLPRHLRQDFANIYAYCRWADDCADEARSPSEATQLLMWWQGEVNSLFRGDRPRHPVMVALSATLQRHHLSQTPFDDLIGAFVQDQTKQRYDNSQELLDYCRRSANPVGRLILQLAQAARDHENLRLSDQICTGLQLANFCQDMARDALLGRIYAPREMWSAHSVDEVMILAGRPTDQLRSLLKAWTIIARRHLEAGAPLRHRVPRWLALDIELFRGGGLAILDEIQRAQFDVWTWRPTVGKLHKLRVLLAALRRRS